MRSSTLLLKFIRMSHTVSNYLLIILVSRETTMPDTPQIQRLQGSNSTSHCISSSPTSFQSMKESGASQFNHESSKAAFLHLMRMLATTFVETKIRFNSITPSVFPSEMTAGSSEEDQKSHVGRETTNLGIRFESEKGMGACSHLLAGHGEGFLDGQVLYPNEGRYFRYPGF
jgi:NAD(P)-dependent dehydrogenase (short-subunit alcohol dehydrogenase family)